MKAYAQKQNRQQQGAPNITRSSATRFAASQTDHPILCLQRMIGNQAVQRLLQSDTEGLGVKAPAENEHLQTKTAHANDHGEISAPPGVNEVLQSSGQPLETSTLGFMKSRFGHDFSQVRVHTDAQAAESARAIDALAYTAGRDVVFGLGHYRPASTEGRKLLAHELTHVLQQRAGVHLANGVSEAGDVYERHADHVADLVAQGQSA